MAYTLVGQEGDWSVNHLFFIASIWWIYLNRIHAFLNQEHHLDNQEIGFYGRISFCFANIESTFGGYDCLGSAGIGE